jgi:hypothetical protein
MRSISAEAISLEGRITSGVVSLTACFEGFASCVLRDFIDDLVL